MATGGISIVGSIIMVVFWVSENVVWAADYSTNQKQNTEVLIQIQIDITEERLERLVDKYNGNIPPEVLPRVKKFEKKIRRLEKQQEVIDRQILND